MSEATITLRDADEAIALLGTRDKYLRQIRDALGIRVVSRNGQLRMEGDPQQVAHATEVFEHLRELIRQQGSITSADVQCTLQAVLRGRPTPAQVPEILPGKVSVRPRTEGQMRFVREVERNDIVLCIGPAGTGKTYLAVAMAVSALLQERIRKIVLVRPAVEAGEKLGFLPGDIIAKVNPYLRPLLDALHDILPYERVKRFMDADMIEILPLAFMRGRTLNHSMIILDEGQNTTVPQMKMFLTRMGEGSKIIVTGDVTQVDLPKGTRSGLIDAATRLEHVSGVSVVRMGPEDIVRHPLVQKIVDAYADTGSA